LPAILTMKVDTNRLISNVAREKLIGEGLTQKGRSRLWYFSGDYYLILVEFQPSSWDKGTYLNVGINFNWYPADHFAFEFGYRLSDFKTSSDEKKFEREVQRLCDLAIDKVNKYKSIFIDKKSAADRLLKLHKGITNDWDKFNIGVLFGLGGQNDKAIHYLEQVTGDNYNYKWEIERAKIAKDYIQDIKSGDLLTRLDEVIAKTKELKGVS